MTEAEQIVSDVLSCALEGGVGYWSLASDIVYDDDAEHTTYLGVTLHEYEDDESKHNHNDAIVQQTIYGDNYYQREGHTITLDDVGKAISAIAFNWQDYKYLDKSIAAVCRDLIFNPDEADYDSGTADTIIQIAALGEVRYG